MSRFGIVGCGNMGTAILAGVLRAGLFDKNDVIVSSLDEKACENIEKEYGVKTTSDNSEVVKDADVVLLSVKPGQLYDVIAGIRDKMKDDVLVISIAAGQPIGKIAEAFSREIHIVRTMPNTPALVGAAATGMCFSEGVTEDEKNFAIKIFESFGEVSVVPESLINAVTGVSGSSPAYVFMMIEAMADAAVADGIPRKDAYKLAAQSVYGSAKLMLETGKHPGELKDMVCSPAGTTIEAVRVLEEKGFRSALIEGQRACTRRAGELS